MNSLFFAQTNELPLPQELIAQTAFAAAGFQMIGSCLFKIVLNFKNLKKNNF